MPDSSLTARLRRGGSAALVATGILTSRIAGLVRERLLAHYLGASGMADVYRAAIRIPQILQNLIGEGIIPASFVSVYGKLGDSEASAETKRTLAWQSLAIIAAATLFIVVAMSVFSGAIIEALTPGFDAETRVRTTTLFRWTIWGVAFWCLSAWAQSVLLAQRRYVLSNLGPFFWNLVMIAVLLGFGHELVEARMPFVLGSAYLAGSLLMFGILFAKSASSLGRYRRTKGVLPETKVMLTNARQLLAARTSIQLASFFEIYTASTLAVGTVASIAYAQFVSMLPLQVLGQAISSADLADLARHAERGYIASRIRASLAKSAPYLAYFGFLFTVFAGESVTLVLQGGRLSAPEAALISALLWGLGWAVPAQNLNRLVSTYFYTTGQTKVAAWTSTLRGAGYVVAALVLTREWTGFGFGPNRGESLIAATTLSILLESALLLHFLVRQVGWRVGLPLAEFGRQAAIGALAALLARTLPLAAVTGSFFHAALRVALFSAAYGGLYLALRRLRGAKARE